LQQNTTRFNYPKLKQIFIRKNCGPEKSF